MTDIPSGRLRSATQTGKRQDTKNTKKTQTQSLCYKFAVRLGKRFHSLQTGKRIQRIIKRSIYRRSTILFPFPSNGKADPKFKRLGTAGLCEEVSIPFKRERGSKDGRVKAIPDLTGDCVSIPFKRERVSKDSKQPTHSIPALVSIPFKRESGSKEGNFDFGDRRSSVSIPFKRERGSKGLFRLLI